MVQPDPWAFRFGIHLINFHWNRWFLPLLQWDYCIFLTKFQRVNENLAIAFSHSRMDDPSADLKGSKKQMDFQSKEFILVLHDLSYEQSDTNPMRYINGFQCYTIIIYDYEIKKWKLGMP